MDAMKGIKKMNRGQKIKKNTQITSLKREIALLRHQVSVRDKIVKNKENDIKEADSGILEITKIYNAYLVATCHERSGVLKLKRSDINDLLKNYKYEFSYDTEYIYLHELPIGKKKITKEA